MNDQLTAEDVSRLYAARRYDEIEQARLDGRLNVLMGGTPPLDTDRQLTEADVKRLYAGRAYDQIETARQQGRLADLLNTTTEGNH